MNERMDKIAIHRSRHAMGLSRSLSGVCMRGHSSGTCLPRQAASWTVHMAGPDE